MIATAVVAGYRYRQFPRALRLFCWFVFLSAATQLTSLGLSLQGVNNMPLLHVYVAVGFPCISSFYGAVLHGYISPKVLRITIGGFTTFTVINTLFIQNIRRFNSNALVVEAVIIIILALFTFIFLLNNAVSGAANATGLGVGWLNSGFFIYYVSCLLIFYFGDTIIFRYSRELNELTWLFHAFFTTVMYVCFLIGLLWSGRKRL